LVPFANIEHGAILDASFGTAAPGDTIFAELGGESLGLRTLGCTRFMLQWDVLGALEAGWLGNEHPFLFLIGPHLLASLELDARLFRTKRWSPYVGVGISGEASVLEHPGLSSSDLTTVNYVDGVGGSVGRGAARIVFGASMLDTRRSLLFYLFGQEQLQGAETVTPAESFTEIGIGARYDVTGSVVATLEGLFGMAPSTTNDYLGLHDTTTRLAAQGSVRKVFANGMWLGLAASIEQDRDHVAYASGVTFDTANAPTFRATLTLGVPLWRKRR
jgi:hypothetical protein